MNTGYYYSLLSSPPKETHIPDCDLTDIRWKGEGAEGMEEGKEVVEMH